MIKEVLSCGRPQRQCKGGSPSSLRRPPFLARRLRTLPEKPMYNLDQVVVTMNFADAMWSLSVLDADYIRVGLIKIDVISASS